MVPSAMPTKVRKTKSPVVPPSPAPSAAPSKEPKSDARARAHAPTAVPTTPKKERRTLRQGDY
jgi:hypothetical protein